MDNSIDLIEVEEEPYTGFFFRRLDDKLIQIVDLNFQKILNFLPDELSLEPGEEEREIKIKIPFVYKKNTVEKELAFKLAIKKVATGKGEEYCSHFLSDKKVFFMYNKPRDAAATTKKILTEILYGRPISLSDFRLYVHYSQNGKIALPNSSLQKVLEELKK